MKAIMMVNSSGITRLSTTD